MNPEHINDAELSTLNSLGAGDTLNRHGQNCIDKAVAEIKRLREELRSQAAQLRFSEKYRLDIAQTAGYEPSADPQWGDIATVLSAKMRRLEAQEGADE